MKTYIEIERRKNVKTSDKTSVARFCDVGSYASDYSASI